MANFNSIEEAYADIIQTLGIALKDALEEGIEKAREYIIKEWYQSYTPKQYIRLNLMMDSLETRYSLRGNTLEGEIYIKEGNHPPSNSGIKTYEELHEWFSSGGRFGEDHQHVIDFTEEQLIANGRAFDIIIHTLKSKGYDFS